MVLGTPVFATRIMWSELVTDDDSRIHAWWTAGASYRTCARLGMASVHLQLLVHGAATVPSSRFCNPGEYGTFFLKVQQVLLCFFVLTRAANFLKRSSRVSA